MTRILGCIQTALSLLLASSVCLGQSRPATEPGAANRVGFTPRLEVAAGGDAMLAFGHYLVESGSDTAAREDLSYLGIHAAFRGRLWQQWSLGLSGTYGWTEQANGYDPIARQDARVTYRLWRVAADGRWHLRGDEAVDPFFEVEAGLAHSDSVLTPRGTTPGLTTASFGAAFGLNFAIGPYASFGPELRALWLPFPDHQQAQDSANGSALYGSVTVVSLGLTLTGRIPLR